MLGFWFLKCWPIFVIMIISIIILIYLIREENAKNKSKEWENPVDAGIRNACIVIYAIFTLVGFVVSMLSLYQVANEYNKTYTIVVNIYYSSNKVVRKVLISKNESFRIEYHDSYAKISGNGVCLQVNAPIEIVNYTYKKNVQ